MFQCTLLVRFFWCYHCCCSACLLFYHCVITVAVQHVCCSTIVLSLLLFSMFVVLPLCYHCCCSACLLFYHCVLTVCCILVWLSTARKPCIGIAVFRRRSIISKHNIPKTFLQEAEIRMLMKTTILNTSGKHRVTNLVIIHEWGKDGIVITTNGLYIYEIICDTDIP